MCHLMKYINCGSKILLSLFRDIHVYSVLSVFELLPKLLYMYKLKNKLFNPLKIFLKY